jgi:hypothetical protein
VKVLVVGQMGMYFHELGSRRIERLTVVTLGVIRSAVAIGALVSVEAGTFGQIGIGRRDWMIRFSELLCREESGQADREAELVVKLKSPIAM